MRLSKFLRERILLVFVILLAGILRFYNIANLPPSLNVDEISHGYNAYSILKTGGDEWGQPFPLLFRAYGDYKLPVYIYATALSEAIFGLSAFAVRLPSVLAGLAIVFFTYFLTKRLFDKRTAVIAAIFVAVEPWSFFLSRVALEANVALAFIVSGVYFFLLATQKAKFLPLSALLLSLSVWTYNSARIFVPLLLALLVVLYRKELVSLWKKGKKLITYSLILIALFFLPMLYQLANPVGQARYGRVAIVDEGAIHQINTARGESNLPPSLARAVYNKVTYFFPRFFQNWALHFSPGFLFKDGGSYGSYSMPGYGLLYPVNAIFLTIGLFVLLRSRDTKSLLLLFWLLLSPIPASLTREVPHTLRAITMLPVPMIISAVGLLNVCLFLRRTPFPKLGTVFLVGYFLMLGGLSEGYLRKYFVNYPKEHSNLWQYGYKEIVQYARQNYTIYDRIVVTKKYSEPHEFLLFYWPWDPERYRNDPSLIRFFQTNWYWVDRFDKFYFVNDWEIPRDGGEWRLESGSTFSCQSPADHCLLITSPGNYPTGWQLLETINFLDGKSAFDILEKT